MADPWNFAGESVSLAQTGGTVTLVEGSAFCISGRSGDVHAGTPQGLIFRDTRFLSRFELRLAGRKPPPAARQPVSARLLRVLARARQLAPVWLPQVLQRAQVRL